MLHRVLLFMFLIILKYKCMKISISKNLFKHFFLLILEEGTLNNYMPILGRFKKKYDSYNN